MIICSNCKNENPDGSLFCDECGTKLEIYVNCPNCGKSLPAGKKFCSACGTRMGAQADISVRDNVFGGNIDGSFNTTINNFAREEIAECHICGKIALKSSGAFYKCRKCGKYCCAEHFDASRISCTECARTAEEEEARRKAEEEAARRREEKAKKRAEEEARRKAEEALRSTSDGHAVYKDGHVEMIPYGTAKIEWGAYMDRKDLVKVSLPESVTEICGGKWGNGAFARCEALREINIPRSVTRIGMNAFYCCRSLERVTLPSGLKKIEEGSFSYCNALAELSVPSGVKRIEECAFKYCTSLIKVILPESVTVIEERAFAGCEALTEIVIPSGVKKISTKAFAYSPNVTVRYGGTYAMWREVYHANDGIKVICKE